jgi:hypothetical protein
VFASRSTASTIPPRAARRARNGLAGTVTQTALTQPSQNPAAPDRTAYPAGTRVVRPFPEDVAYRTAARLREALFAAGFEADRDFPALRGDVTNSAEPFITLGRFRPAAAEQLAELLFAVSSAACATALATGATVASAADSGRI